jgi:hypothetical protein
MDFKGLSEEEACKSLTWTTIARDFVLGKRTAYIEDFLGNVHKSKIDEEKEIKFKLDMIVIDQGLALETFGFSKSMIQRL